MNQGEAEATSEEASSQQQTSISKNQLKKQRKRERWQAIKQERRRHIKENRKHRLAELREKGEDTGPTRKRLKSNTMKNSSCKIRVVIDLSLDDYMTEKDVNSLACQLQHSYSANRRAQNPMQLYFCGFGGKTKKRLDEIGDYKGWDIYTETLDYSQFFPKESLIYLSSESPNILTTLSEDKVYVIGGLVDHNKHKGLCHKIAEEKGIAHAQLPITEYLDMKTRKVLTVNQVFSILLRYTETNDWKTAFLAEMPQRKQAQPKGCNSDGVMSSVESSSPANISQVSNDPSVSKQNDLEDNTNPKSINPSINKQNDLEDQTNHELNNPCENGHRTQKQDLLVDGSEKSLEECQEKDFVKEESVCDPRNNIVEANNKKDVEKADIIQFPADGSS